jgi:hypothetical protein
MSVVDKSIMLGAIKTSIGKLDEARDRMESLFIPLQTRPLEEQLKAIMSVLSSLQMSVMTAEDEDIQDYIVWWGSELQKHVVAMEMLGDVIMKRGFHPRFVNQFKLLVQRCTCVILHIQQDVSWLVLHICNLMAVMPYAKLFPGKRCREPAKSKKRRERKLNETMKQKHELHYQELRD